ncbi:hypothetical protein GCM10023092_08110 [Rurimicrobium arvi]|uniref:TerB family tellurite resistance protein n=2 Tax=Rurimicrobium arvi TaxID=2049916 RepID=A0ABP8MIB7_9BACT
MNKTMAGYHILMILSAVDFRFNPNEDIVIRDYLLHEFPFHVNLDKQMATISNLKPDEWESHYIKAIEDFYDDSTEQERLKLLDFAMQLCKADSVITKTENHYLNLLFEAWDPQ